MRISTLHLSVVFFFFCLNISASNDFNKSQSLSNALATAETNNKNIFVNFKAEWCLPCQMFKGDVLYNEQVSQILDQEFVSVEVDIDDVDQGEWIEEYQVGCLPTSLVLDEKGLILKEITGHLSVPELLDLLSAYTKSSALVENTTFVLPKVEKSTPSVSEEPIVYTATKPEAPKAAPKKMMNNVVISRAEPLRTVTVGAFASVDNVTNYKAKLEAELGFDFFITMNDKSLYQLNVGRFNSKMEAKEIIESLKKNNSEYYIRVLK